MVVKIPQSLKETIKAFKKQNSKIASIEMKKNSAFNKYLSTNKTSDKKRYRDLKKKLNAAEKTNEIRANKILNFAEKNNISPRNLF